jgi:hypothetical protein
MMEGSDLTISQRYKFVESIDNLFLNFWHKLWKSPGELCSDDGDMIRIHGSEMPSESVFGLKCLDMFQSVEQRRLERKLLTSSTASSKDNMSSGAFRISSIILGSVATTIHCSKSGILNIVFGHWENYLNIACKRS